jgi:hypothetical protein
MQKTTSRCVVITGTILNKFSPPNRRRVKIYTGGKTRGNSLFLAGSQRQIDTPRVPRGEMNNQNCDTNTMRVCEHVCQHKSAQVKDLITLGPDQTTPSVSQNQALKFSQKNFG